jgi:glycosyltransferase involved in cell wall biosynthesis
LIAGEGPERASLVALAHRLRVDSRVRFLGLVAHDEIAMVYNAADILILASAREGMPNVVLEALACGTPVVATDVGGVGEVLTSPAAGLLMRDRSAAALVEALESELAAPPDRAATRAFAERFAWGPVVERQVALYRSVARGAGLAEAVPS